MKGKEKLNKLKRVARQALLTDPKNRSNRTSYAKNIVLRSVFLATFFGGELLSTVHAKYVIALFRNIIDAKKEKEESGGSPVLLVGHYNCFIV